MSNGKKQGVLDCITNAVFKLRLHRPEKRPEHHNQQNSNATYYDKSLRSTICSAHNHHKIINHRDQHNQEENCRRFQICAKCSPELSRRICCLVLLIVQHDPVQCCCRCSNCKDWNTEDQIHHVSIIKSATFVKNCMTGESGL